MQLMRYLRDEFLKNNISFYSIISNLFELLKTIKICYKKISSNYKNIDEMVKEGSYEDSKKEKIKKDKMKNFLY